jgi:cation diffusion facilitator family transporter
MGQTPQNWQHDYVLRNESIKRNEKRTLAVVLLSFAMMVIEISAGYLTDSMSLLADGWHMASHVGALTIAYFAYRFASSPEWNQRFSFGAGKFIPLGGYTSAVVLFGVSLIMATESAFRLVDPRPIHFNEAMVVAVIGLVVNLVCAWILGDSHSHGHSHGPEHGHDHDHSHGHTHDPQVEQPAHAKRVVHGHSDANLRGAYFHVLADAVTSFFAIAALAAGKWLNLSMMDALMGIISSIIILRWALMLCKDTAWELLDGHPQHIDPADIRKLIEGKDTQVQDIHVWTIAPKTYACELVVSTKSPEGPDFYRARLAKQFHFDHIVVEERIH